MAHQLHLSACLKNLKDGIFACRLLRQKTSNELINLVNLSCLIMGRSHYGAQTSQQIGQVTIGGVKGGYSTQQRGGAFQMLSTARKNFRTTCLTNGLSEIKEHLCGT